MTDDDSHFVPNLRDTVEAEQFLFDLPGVLHVNILGINALGLVHGHQGELMAILRRGGSVDVLLLDPETEAFRDQCVSKYANAVISQWFLPYNIRPKDDWLREIAETGLAEKD